MGRYFDFNTQRPYTKRGQIIRCYREPSRHEFALDDDWDIWFYDISRNIIGKLSCVPGKRADQHYVMGAYDANKYEIPSFDDRGIREIIRCFGPVSPEEQEGDYEPSAKQA